MEQQTLQMQMNVTNTSTAGSGGTITSTPSTPSPTGVFSFDVEFDSSNYFQFQIANNDPSSTPLAATVDWGNGETQTVNVNAFGSVAINKTYADSSNRTITVTTTDPYDYIGFQFNGSDLVPGSGNVTTLNNFNNFPNFSYLSLYSSSVAGPIDISSQYVYAIDVNSNSSITEINLPNINTDFFNITAKNNPSLTTVTLNSPLPILETVEFTNCALTQEVVDNLLVIADTSTSEYPGIIDFSGGTNSPPSTIGLAVTGSLIAKGFTVLVN